LVTGNRKYIFVAENLLKRLFFCCERVRHVISPANNLKRFLVCQYTGFPGVGASIDAASHAQRSATPQDWLLMLIRTGGGFGSCWADSARY
jgi:hypothetical protein